MKKREMDKTIYRAIRESMPLKGKNKKNTQCSTNMFMKHIPNQILIRLGNRKSVSELTENFVSFTKLFCFPNSCQVNHKKHCIRAFCTLKI